MRKLLLLFIALFILIHAQSQTYIIDSLRQLLQKEKADTTRVKLLCELSFRLLESKTDSAMKLALEALDLARRIHYEPGEANSLNRVGNSYSMLGDYSKAMKSYFAALRINEKLNNVAGQATNYNNLGLIYLKKNSYKSALEYLVKARELAEEVDSKTQVAITLSNIARAYRDAKSYDSAMFFAQQSYELSNILNYPRAAGLALTILGDISFQTHQHGAALDYCHLSLRYLNEAESFNFIADAYLTIARVYEKLNEKDSATFYSHQSLQIARERKFTEQVRDAARFLSYFYRKYNADSAFFYQDISKAMNDSLFSQEKQRDFQSLEFDEQLKQQEQQNLKAAYQNKLRLYVVLGVLALTVIIAFFQLSRNKKQQRANRMLQEQKQQIQKTLAELKTTQAQLIQQEKMASLGELTAGIAHEIQNPLNFVNNFSEINKELLTELRDELEKRNYSEVSSIAEDVIRNEEKIRYHGKRADVIVKGMLQHTKSGTGRKESVNINVLADEYLKLSYHGLRAKDKEFAATINTSFDPSIGHVNVVPEDIGRVMLNLYNNAFYAVREKKKQLDGNYEPRISVTTKKTANNIHLIVRDNGNGISQDVITKIYQPFFTTKPTGQGTGLGLSLSYDIVKAHNGEIQAQSNVGEGTEFTVLLPADLN